MTSSAIADSHSPKLNAPLHLSDLINASTRPTHTQLNRLIMERLPLALPPNSTNPNTYLKGLIHIAPIYITFESLWQSILETAIPIDVSPKDYNNISTVNDSELSRSPTFKNGLAPKARQHSYPCARIQPLLSRLRLPELVRSARLKLDLQPLAYQMDQVETELRAVSQTGPLASFLAHIKLSVTKNPHVLIAYMWVLYMALFSGGRVLRASLQELFTSEPGSGLHFFNFQGEEDGEDIRREFKKRIIEVEDVLTLEEKADIVLEAQEIFNYMIQVVLYLDEIFGNDGNEQYITRKQSEVIGQEKVDRTRNNHFEVVGLILALVLWYCFRWWRYLNSEAVSNATLESSKEII